MKNNLKFKYRQGFSLIRTHTRILLVGMHIVTTLENYLVPSPNLNEWVPVLGIENLSRGLISPYFWFYNSTFFYTPTTNLYTDLTIYFIMFTEALFIRTTNCKQFKFSSRVDLIHCGTFKEWILHGLIIYCCM